MPTTQAIVRRLSPRSAKGELLSCAASAGLSRREPPMAAQDRMAVRRGEDGPRGPRCGPRAARAARAAFVGDAPRGSRGWTRSTIRTQRSRHPSSQRGAPLGAHRAGGIPARTPHDGSAADRGSPRAGRGGAARAGDPRAAALATQARDPRAHHQRQADDQARARARTDALPGGRGHRAAADARRVRRRRAARARSSRASTTSTSTCRRAPAPSS